MKEEHKNKYIAFISYRHLELDKKAAEMIQKRIESYTIPREFREKPEDKKFGLCFRDEDELTASASLSDSIYRALDASKFLIVICTPDLPKSDWCRQEIEYFLKTHDRDHIIAVLVDGTPAMSFPDLLVHTYDEKGNITGDCEPLAANITGPGASVNTDVLKKESVRIFAAMLGCPFDALWQRERRALAMRMFSISLIVFAFLLVFIGVTMNRNKKISEQNLELARQLSAVHTDSGYSLLEDLQLEDALVEGNKAVESNDPTVYDHRAIRLLNDVLGAYETDRLTSYTDYRQRMAIRDIWVTADEQHLILLEESGTIRCLTMGWLTLDWSYGTESRDTEIYAALPDRILCKNSNGVTALSLENGEVLWSFASSGKAAGNNFQALSGDGRLFAVLDEIPAGDGSWEKDVCVRILDTANGRQISSCVLQMKDDFQADFSKSFPAAAYSATFTEDGSALIFALPVKLEKNGAVRERKSSIRMIDLQENEEKTMMEDDRKLIYDGFVLNEDGSLVSFASLAADGYEWMTACPVSKDTDYAEVGSSMNHSFRTADGVSEDEEDIYSVNRCRMLHYQSIVIVFSDNTIFVFDDTTTGAYRTFTLSGQIRNAFWVDQEDGLFEVVCSDGWVVDYQLDPERPTELIAPVNSLDLGYELRRAVPVLGTLARDEEAIMLGLPEDTKGQIVKTARLSDHHGGKLMYFPETGYNDIKGLCLVPETDQCMMFSYANNGRVKMSVLERDSWQEVSSCVFNEDINVSEVVPLDPEHFLCGQLIYGADGTSGYYGEPFYGISKAENPVYPRMHILMTDGSVLSAASVIEPELGGGSEDYLPAVCAVWKDGKLMEASQNAKTAMITALDPEEEEAVESRDIVLGKNGLVIRYGRDLHPDTGENAPAPRYSVFNVNDETLIQMDDPSVSGAVQTIAAAQEKPWFAVSYDNGYIYFFDMEKREAVELSGYSIGEILTLGFSEDDQYLAVLLSDGPIDLYSTDTLKQKCRITTDTMGSLDSDSEAYSSDYRNGSAFRFFATLTDDETMFLAVATNNSNTAGCVVIDLTGETTRSEIGDVYAADLENGKLYTRRGKKLIRYPVYSRKDLIEWAGCGWLAAPEETEE